MTSFDQSQHPRNAAGTSKGGQFAQKQHSVPEAELELATSATDKWLTAFRHESELERQLQAARETRVGLNSGVAAQVTKLEKHLKSARLATVKAGASVVKATILEHFPDAVSVRFDAWVEVEGDWDERTHRLEGAYDSAGERVADGSQLFALQPPGTRDRLLYDTHNLLGVLEEDWLDTFEVIGDGPDEYGNGSYVIDFEKF